MSHDRENNKGPAVTAPGTPAETETESANTRHAQAETRAEQAATRTTQATIDLEQAITRKLQAEVRAAQEMTRLAQAETQVDQENTRLAQATTQTQQTNTKAMEQAVRTSELSYRRLFEAAQDGILILDVDTGRITDANPFLVDLLGYSHAEMVGKTVGELSPFQDIIHNQAMLERLQKEGYVRYEDLPLKTKDHRSIAVEFVSNIYQAGDRKVIQCNIRDITSRKQADAATNLLRAIVESSNDAIISKNLNGVIISCNQGASRLFGYAMEELIGQPMTTLIPAAQQNEEVDVLSRNQRGERIENFETVRQHKSGELIAVSLTISPVKNAIGLIIGASHIARDITERKRSEQSLAESYQREKTAREFAETANRAKDDFLASLSHELRTPLNPVLMLASDQEENSELSPETRNHFGIIHKNIELEARLIDDLLDLTRITQRKLFLNQRLFDAVPLLRDAVAIVQSEVNEKQIELVLNVPAFPLPIYGDEVRLQQVFWNVIKNAVKFTPMLGKIVIDTALVDQKVQVTVTDTGMGMTPAEVARIFGAFSQGDHGANSIHRFGGLGLGLSIARQLVELHAGLIRAHSAGRDLGSTFVIELPLAKIEKADLKLLASSRNVAAVPLFGNDRRLLLIEDHVPTRIALSHLLRRRNFTVVEAANCLEARAKCAEAHFDLVISDIGLPDGNGNEIMKELRDTYNLSGIALTGYGMEHDIARSHESGFFAHLVKPVNVQTLEKTLKAYFGS